MASTPLVKGTPNWHELINQNFADIDSQLASKADYDDTGWLSLPLLGEAAGSPKFRRNNGVVYLCGGISNASQGQYIAQLPEGCRPWLYPCFVCPINAQGGSLTMVTVANDGRLKVFWSSLEKPVAIILDAIAFKTQ